MRDGGRSRRVGLLSLKDRLGYRLRWGDLDLDCLGRSDRLLFLLFIGPVFRFPLQACWRDQTLSQTRIIIVKRGPRLRRDRLSCCFARGSGIGIDWNCAGGDSFGQP